MNETIHTDSANNDEAGYDEAGYDEAGYDEARRPASQLFTVRIWSDLSAQGVVTWRGKVQHVPNGAWRYFHDWSALTTFLQTQIEEMTALPPQPAP